MGKSVLKKPATIGISEWVAYCPSFSKKVVRTSRRREMFLRSVSTRNFHMSVPIFLSKIIYLLLGYFPITIINAATVRRAFSVSVRVMHPAKRTSLSVFRAKASYCCTDLQTVRTVRWPDLFLNLSNSRY